MSRHARKQERRLRRQFDAIARFAPASRRLIETLLKSHMRLVRVPLGILMIVGGVFSFLPVLGVWMLPLGLMLLAVDVPLLRPQVTAALIRFRRWWAVRRHKKRPDESTE
jgi:hypothetical protein